MEMCLKYLQESESDLLNFKKLIITTSAVLVTVFGMLLRRYVSKRKIYSANIPMRKTKFWDLLGIFGDFLFCAKLNKLSQNIYIMQILNGYHQLFKHEKFFCAWLSLIPVVIITKADAVESLIARAGSINMEKAWFYNWLHPWLGTGLLTSHGSKWKSRRKLLTPAFHFDILKDFLPVFNEQSQLLVNLLRKEAEKPWTDIVTPITLCSLDIICETTLGVSIGAQKNIKSKYVQVVHRTSKNAVQRFIHPTQWADWSFNLTSSGKQFKKDVEYLHRFTDSIISSKKKNFDFNEENHKRKRKALMDLLLEQHIRTESLSENDIREEVDTFAFEGHDTTSMGMSWALYLIGLHKDIQEKAHEEMDRIFGDDFERPVSSEDLNDMEYLERILKESQRLYPSVPFIGRQFNEDIDLCGTKIPKGVACVIASYFVHRDESVYPNPDKFDPDRFLPENSIHRHPYAYVPFSAGSRNCIGQRFAVMEEKVVIANILRNYTLESLDPRDKVMIEPVLVLRAGVPLRIKLRSRT